MDFFVWIGSIMTYTNKKSLKKDENGFAKAKLKVYAYEDSFAKAKLKVNAYEVSFAEAKLLGGTK
ncbi:hypothetical protein GON05_15350 [Paenibacillus sp. MAH-34]|uniref:NEAT domain-containing protein n=2 Tax=Paenibacillus TaxID=44249 RepID=A0ABW9UC85_9BACL|nr:hypothetical protein [Paenibacillus anseongense]MVQ35995.1 hypothetical protein [Paenibacillus anseongense]